MLSPSSGAYILFVLTCIKTRIVSRKKILLWMVFRVNCLPAPEFHYKRQAAPGILCGPVALQNTPPTHVRNSMLVPHRALPVVVRRLDIGIERRPGDTDRLADFV